MISALSRKTADGVREAGLLARIEALRGLRKSSGAAWDPHLAVTRQTVTDALAFADAAHTLQVHTTGWSLEDLPLEALSMHLSGATLTAPVWWRSARRMAKRHTALRFELDDATGGHLSEFAKAPETAQPGQARLGAVGGGMAMSVNLLSELVGTVSAIHHPSEADQDRARALTGAHIAALERTRDKALLITPFARYETRRGKSERLELVPPRLLKADPFTQWDWHMAPRGVLEPDLDVHVKVGAWWL